MFLSNSNNIGKPMNIYLESFLNASSNHMSNWYYLVSQPINKFNSSYEISNSMDLLYVTVGIILVSKLCSKNSSSPQIRQGKQVKNWNSYKNWPTIKILLDCCASVSIVDEDILHKCYKIFSKKWTFYLLW